MIALLWGIGCGVCGLLWVMMESMTGRLQAGESIETQVLWLMLTPIAAIGCMVHKRKQESVFPYSAAIKTGMLATLWGSVALTVVWMLVVMVLVPDYQTIVEVGITKQSIKAGETVQQLAQRINAAKMLRTPPMLFGISFILPMVVGTVASIIGAIGLRTKQRT